ncbi:MAG: hypothetical protein HRT61_01045 [Ekhidna sp.]|nr:hypothetical protein [Ekhidna sp.]
MQENGYVKDRKLWLLDCDSEEQYERIHESGLAIQYGYDTKNGKHTLITPQDMRGLNMKEKQTSKRIKPDE